MIRVTLNWHTAAEDLDLGECFMDAVPPAGTLLGYSSASVAPNESCWRVVFVMAYPSMPGSANVRAVVEGRRPLNGQVAQYVAFVEPTDGPFH